MTAHIRVPELTGDDPATFSRRRCRPAAAASTASTAWSITDALEMKGRAPAAGGIAPAAVRALAAGADLLCIGAEVDRELVEAIAAEIVAAVGDGGLPLPVGGGGSRTAMATWSATPAAGVTTTRPGVPPLGGRYGSRAPLAGPRAPLVVQLESGISIAEGRVPWGLRRT
jgi:beta-N-acetylhexosaminidase